MKKIMNVVLVAIIAVVVAQINVDAKVKECPLNLKKWQSCVKIVSGKTENSLIYDYGTKRPGDDASISGWAYTKNGTKRYLNLSGYIEVKSKRVSLSKEKKNAVKTHIKQSVTLKGYDYATKHGGLTSRSGSEYAKFKK
ncbi:hypothetical protein OKW22_000086 [Bacilli bacterium PM5-3]|nr:hypothetical protein [Bacilli bacterium PM5-3]